MTVATRDWPSLAEVVDDIRAIVSDSRTIGCMAHKDADADSLGSALAFALSLRETGKRVHVVVPEPLPTLLSYLQGFDTIETSQPPVDALFTFDCATLERFGEARSYVENARQVISIDHHASNSGFGSINLIEPAASATGQVVFKLLSEIGAPITPAVATNLYAALFTDTGGFRHENTTEGALRLGAELVALGADPAFVALRSYKWRSIPRVRLEGLAIAGLQAECGGRLVWSQITQAMLEEAGADMQESEGVIDTLQSIDTMNIAILFKENGSVSTKVSVRSRDPYNATDVCTPFGGGGHQRAAGAELAEPLSSARLKVLDVARRMLTR
jgi:phosphoesterase RecJ-like protein